MKINPILVFPALVFCTMISLFNDVVFQKIWSHEAPIAWEITQVDIEKAHQLSPEPMIMQVDRVWSKAEFVAMQKILARTDADLQKYKTEWEILKVRQTSLSSSELKRARELRDLLVRVTATRQAQCFMYGQRVATVSRAQLEEWGIPLIPPPPKVHLFAGTGN